MRSQDMRPPLTLLLLLIAGIATIACGDEGEPDEDQTGLLQGELTVSRSGGIAGLSQSATITADDTVSFKLSTDADTQVATVDPDTIRAARQALSSVPPGSASRRQGPPIADGLTYVIAHDGRPILTGGDGYEVSAEQSAAIQAMLAVLDEAIARSG